MRMIFYYPGVFIKKPKSASEIRPIKMINAFQKLGYTVDIISGYSNERKEALRVLKDRIWTGVRYDFVYVENTTLPIFLNDKHHLPVHPFLEVDFFSLCKKMNIPICLFYRDIYWLFPEYGNVLPFYKRIYAKIFYYLELFLFQKYVDIIYIPSLKMANYIPVISYDKFKELLPGCELKSFKINSTEKKLHSKYKLTIMYVGGIGLYYKMHELFKAVCSFPEVKLIICTREDEWSSAFHEYRNYMCENIEIIHKKEDDLEELYSISDISVIFVEPNKYREFAVPFKLFEAIGYNKPIIASEGTYCGDFVEKTGIGWKVPYDEKCLRDLLYKIINNPKELENKKNKVYQIRTLHTWEVRAKQVINDVKTFRNKSL